MDKKEAGTLNDLNVLERAITVALDKYKLVATKEKKGIVVRSPREIKYGEVVKVVNLARSLGASPISMQIDNSAQ